MARGNVLREICGCPAAQHRANHDSSEDDRVETNGVDGRCQGPLRFNARFEWDLLMNGW